MLKFGSKPEKQPIFQVIEAVASNTKANKLPFNFERRNEWYACQNACPHKMEMVLSRGMTGSADGVPKIAYPMHKKTFSLVDGSNLNGDDLKIATYPVKIVNDEVFVGFLD